MTDATRKVIVSIATSADGFIARPDGDIDWLHRPNTAGDYGMAAFRRSIDAILLGRKTYELSLTLGARFGTGPRHYVFTRRPDEIARAQGAEFVTEPPASFIARLRAQATGKDIWMMGGGELIGAFVDDGLIDEFIVHVMPVFIGEGIPLIAPRHRQVPLTLQSATPYADGVVRLHYRV